MLSTRTLENTLFILAMLLFVVGGGSAIFKFAFDMGKRSASATQQNDDYIRASIGDTATYMGMTASSTMSIYKVRQGYDALGQTLNPSVLLNGRVNFQKNFSHLPTAIMFFTQKSCQICVGEMFELLYSLTDSCNRLNVIAICRSPDKLAAEAYRPINFPNVIYVIDTCSEATSSIFSPDWLYIEPHKPIVLIVDSSSNVVASYFLQEKDMDTRRRFAESVLRLLSKENFHER